MLEWRDDAQKEFDRTAASVKTKGGCKSGVAFHRFVDVLKDDKYSHVNGGDRAEQFRRGLFAFQDKYCVVGSHLTCINEEGGYIGAVCGAAPAGGVILTPGHITFPTACGSLNVHLSR